MQIIMSYVNVYFLDFPVNSVQKDPMHRQMRPHLGAKETY